MKQLLIFICTLYCSLIITLRTVAQQERPLKLWYNKPANAAAVDLKDGWESDSEWLKALPVGNGFLGAMVFGDVNRERIQLNEKSLWSGSPDDNNNPEAAKALDTIRQLLFGGKYKQANALINQTQVCKGAGSGGGNGANVPYGCFQTLGDLRFEFENHASYSNYRRELDLKRGVITVSYVQGGIKFRREVFASYPDRAIIIRITASKKGAINFTSTLTRPERSFTRPDGKQLLMTGRMDNGKGGEGLAYAARLKAKSIGGKIVYKDSLLNVQNASEVVLIFTAATNYKLHYPDYRGEDPLVTTSEQLQKSSSLSFSELIGRHEKDFSSLFDRVNLHLSGTTPDNMPTDILLRNPDNKHLYELYFQYGRYLLISSSREGSLPSNEQGGWANKIQTPWNCDYHANINVQMNYWPADVTNLSACFSPFAELIKSLEVPGEVTARTQYNAGGWCMGPITNVWGYTAPGEGASWGMYLSGGGWLCQQLWDHYAYTLDSSYLQTIYPVMLKAARFYLDWLVKDPVTGKLVSGPATSPENGFVAPDGYVGAMSMGPSHDQEILAEFFATTLKAAAILNDKDTLIAKIDAALKNLAQPGIGLDGRLMEWAHEFKETEPTHRHVSHLYMLYPGSQINPQKTPALAQAAKKTLEARTDIGTGWSLAWKVSFWARLQDGEHAYGLLKNLLRPTTSYKVQMSNAGGTYPNLFCGHPPFQIDGNFGGTAGIAEMLVQSYAGEIYLLPAIPATWAEGSVNGLLIRGNFRIGMKWNNHRLSEVKVKSNKGDECIIRSAVPLYSTDVKTKKVNDGNGYRIGFNTVAGKSYLLRREVN